MSPVGIILAIIAAVAAVGGAVASSRAASATQDAEEKARDIDIRTAELDRARRARRAIEASRIQRGDIEAASQAQNTGANSAVAGAIGSLQTQTASNVGALNTQLAGSIAASGRRAKGSKEATRLSNIAGGFSAIGSISIAALSVTGFSDPKPLSKPAPKINPTVIVKKPLPALFGI